ncbi:hypothetical protein [Massilia cavernae]|uniref:Uncharacterized protein n=1 Tax=Massilia cavernae TaxID=2320864 RepID=A0A418Y718_9BURK|nr:hypothetical protein [Massilia cavernae]RJG24742.1 hypothetical protein D3872_03270 [Massilia cavernae]
MKWEPSAMRASTKACAPEAPASVGIGMPNWVPWPPAAVTRVPAENRSAWWRLAPAAIARMTSCISCTEVNMSTWVVTPNSSGSSRWR